MSVQVKCWGQVGIVAALALGIGAGTAAAQNNTMTPVKPDAATNNNVQGAGSGSGGGSPNTVVDSSNGGVAGTGLGKMPPKGMSPGTGNSVPGAAGQAISNSTDTAK